MGAVNTTYTFTATDTITSTKMNDIIDQTTFTDDAVFDTTLAVAAGKLKVKAQGITSNELADGAVLTGKIVDANVTTAKIADDAVTTAKIADLSITVAKLGGSGIPIQISQVVKTDSQTVTAGSWVDISSFLLTSSRLRLTSKHRVQAVISCSSNVGDASGFGGVGFRIVRRIGGIDTIVGVGVSTAGANARLITSYGAYLTDRSVLQTAIDFIDDTSSNSASSISYVIQVISQATAYINRSVANDNLVYTYAPISTLTVTEIS